MISDVLLIRAIESLINKIELILHTVINLGLCIAICVYGIRWKFILVNITIEFSMRNEINVNVLESAKYIRTGYLCDITLIVMLYGYLFFLPRRFTRVSLACFTIMLT